MYLCKFSWSFLFFFYKNSLSRNTTLTLAINFILIKCFLWQQLKLKKKKKTPPKSNKSPFPRGDKQKKTQIAFSFWLNIQQEKTRQYNNRLSSRFVVERVSSLVSFESDSILWLPKKHPKFMNHQNYTKYVFIWHEMVRNYHYLCVVIKPVQNPRAKKEIPFMKPSLVCVNSSGGVFV